MPIHPSARRPATRDESTRPICGSAALLVLQLLASLSAAIANAAEGVEQITVYALPIERFAFDSVEIEVDSAPLPPDNIRELISRIPGVDANGQGGDFQTFSIRGISRQRIQTRIGDAPIVSERRAGASVSFVDPALLGTAEVVRGPASTLFGSGALGGAVLLEPARYDGFAGNLGYASQGNRNAQGVGWGSDHWTLGVARRQSFDDETPDGDERFSRFERVSALVGVHRQVKGLDFDLTLIPAIGWEIGKPNTDYPQRTTSYPRERHAVITGAVASPEQWRFAFYVHPNDLRTKVEEPLQRSRIENEAVDFGLSLGSHHILPWKLSAEAGFDYTARRKVSTEEAQTPLDASGARSGPDRHLQSLSDGEEDELGARLSVLWQKADFGVEGGVRGSFIRQTSAGHSQDTNGSANAFLAGRAQLPWGFEAFANLSTGLRYPSLTERYFSGTTGRGVVVGNPGLRSERSFAVDGKLGWRAERAHLSIGLFGNHIDRYIERVEVTPDQFSFRNLPEGVIWGVEGEGSVDLSDGAELFARGNWMRGRSKGGNALADVPPANFTTGIRYTAGRFRGEFAYQHRFDKRDPGPGERAISDANLLDLALRARICQNLWLGFFVANLSDQRYRLTADDKAVPEAGWSFGVSLRWLPPSAE